MSGDRGVRVHAMSDEWDALPREATSFTLDDDPTETPLDEFLQPSEEVLRVARKIAGQYVEIVARFAASAFGRQTAPTSPAEVRTAITTLRRLADAAGDREQLDLLNRFLDLIEPATTGRRRSQRRQRALVALRSWLPEFAGTLDETDGRRLVHLVRWDQDAAPLLTELRNIRGIGPKRLQRLYSAGLFRVDVVAGAEPDEIVAVTGIPAALAVAVVEATHEYALAERQRSITGIVERVNRLRRILRVVPDEDGSVADSARAALREVQRAMQEIEGMREGIR